MAKISVLMPVYNAGEFLDESISSILNQSFTDFDFLILDDASQDNSLNIIQNYAKKDSRIQVFQNKTNQKAAFCRNALLKEVKTKIIAWMDADDISLPQRLQTQYDFLQNNSHVDIVGSISENFFGLEKDYEIKSLLFFQGSALLNPSVMMKMDKIQKYNICYKNHLIAAQDYQFWTECMPFMRFANIQEKLIKYRVHKGQITFRLREIQKKNHIQILQKNFQNFGFNVSGQLLKTIIWNEGKITKQTFSQARKEYYQPILSIKIFYGYQKGVFKYAMIKSFLRMLGENKTQKLTMFLSLSFADQCFFLRHFVGGYLKIKAFNKP